VTLLRDTKRLIERVCCEGDPDGELDAVAERLGVALADLDGHAEGLDPGLDEGLPDGDWLPDGHAALPLGDDDALDDAEADAEADELALADALPDAEPDGAGLEGQGGRGPIPHVGSPCASAGTSERTPKTWPTGVSGTSSAIHATSATRAVLLLDLLAIAPPPRRQPLAAPETREDIL